MNENLELKIKPLSDKNKVNDVSEIVDNLKLTITNKCINKAGEVFRKISVQLLGIDLDIIV